MLNQGLIQAYITPSGEFNFAPLGLSLRAAGRGLKSLIVRFLTHELDEGYGIASKHLSPFFHSELIDLPRYVPKQQDDPFTIEQQIFELKQTISAGNYDLVHFLGLDRTLESGVLNIEDLNEACETKPKHVEFVFAGTNLPRSLLDRADLVTNMVVKTSTAPKPPTTPVSNLVEVVTGDGKGKTTYCLGKALLASSLGIPCLFLQFVKSPMRYGETIAIDRLPNYTIKTMGKGFLFPKNGKVDEKHRKAAREAWEEFGRILSSAQYKLIVLDEINIAIHYDLLEAKVVAKAIRERPSGIDLILSGRNAHPEIIESADKVIEMQEVRHPFQKGIKARKGIEY
ncbi:MAG: hypothetical protein DRG71_00180 [Deltaproteobacteria bacterium]|nr:MAG: hypothetical protein DRG71_00180 [Deltaproteobacteria bacterium]HDG98609.1 hypothetical protein [Desulfobacterales bacterium]